MNARRAATGRGAYLVGMRSTPLVASNHRARWCTVAAAVLALSGCGSGSGSDAADADDPSPFADCQASDETEPAFPIQAGDELILTEQNGWLYRGERRALTELGMQREASELSGGASGVQALYVNPDGQHDWNEFLWDDPMWSERTSDEPTWATHEEPGAFEPPYQFAYATALGFATQMAATLEDRVFEGTVTSDGVEYLLYCADPAGFLYLDDDVPRTLRFAVHPDGYVTEWSMALVAPDEVSCDESTLRISADLDAVGLHDEPPAEWMTALTLVPSCRGVNETESAKFVAAHGTSAATAPAGSALPESTEPTATVVATGWHDDVNAECAAIMASAAGGAIDVPIEEMAQQFEDWSNDAPGDQERAALAAAAAALRSEKTRVDLEAMDGIGRDLTNAGLGSCGAMFISGG